MKKAVIIGLENQDGYYLSELLISKGYDIIGIFKCKELLKDYVYYSNRIKYLNLMENDIEHILIKFKPDEIYNLYESNGSLTRKILKYISVYELKSKYYQSSNELLFKKILDEDTSEDEFLINSKGYLYSYWRTKSYRECYNLFACNGVLFNHESVKCREKYSASVIAEAVVMIYFGLKDTIFIDNLDFKKEWGYTRDYIEGIWLMMQKDVSSDYVLSTNERHSIREFIEIAFIKVGIYIVWKKVAGFEYGYNKTDGKLLVKACDNNFNNVSILHGNAKKAERILNWNRKVSFANLVEKFVTYYKKLYLKEIYCKDNLQQK